MKRFLRGVVEYSSGADIVVADNGSTDSSLEWLSQSVPDVRVIELGHNYGFAEGYNRALRSVKSEYYLLLNSDVEVREGWLQPMLHYMESHPDTAACQPKLLCQRSPESFEYAGASGGYIDSLGYPYCRGRVFGTIENDLGQYEENVSCHWASGACLLVRSKDYWAVGGMDARFFAHQEEIDLCLRLRARGLDIACVPQSVVYHVGGGTLSAGNPYKTFLNFRNNLLLLYKNLPEQRLRPVMRWRLLLDALASLRFLLLCQFRSSCAVWRAWRAYAMMKHDFENDRRVNQEKAVRDPFGGTVGSILWQYYVKGRRIWGQINVVGKV